MSIGSRKVTKRQWYAAGGFANPLCWRRDRGRGWEYFIRVEGAA